MKIGYPNHPRKDILKEIEWIGKNSFDFVDLFLEEDKAVPEKINIEKVKELLKKYKLDTVGHTAYYLPIGSPVKAIRDTSVYEAKRYFDVFQKLNVKYVTIHANWASGLFSEKECIDFQVETLDRIITEAERYNIRIMLEPITKPQDNIKNISEILKRLPNLYLHLDIGHANLNGNKPEEFIKKFHKRLKHIHMHDNNSRDDLHNPIGTGNIDWKELIKTIKRYYDGTITLEIFSEDKDYILISKNKLQKLWNKH